MAPHFDSRCQNIEWASQQFVTADDFYTNQHVVITESHSTDPGRATNSQRFSLLAPQQIFRGQNTLSRAHPHVGMVPGVTQGVKTGPGMFKLTWASLNLDWPVNFIQICIEIVQDLQD